MTDPDPRGPAGALFDRLARPTLGGVPDGELLARFRCRGDQPAFAEVVHRHGAMVLGVARRIAPADADDVAQAAFLVLARRADEFAGRGTVGDFLHGVARRLALKARSAAARRAEVERRAARPEGSAVGREPDTGFDVDQLLANLPAKYRAAVVLCDLEGVSRRDAASRLSVPEGTVSSRLDAAHKLLAARLSRLGVKLSVATLLAGAATSGAPAGLVRAATALASISAGHIAGTVPAAVLALAAKGGLAMTSAKLAVAIAVAGAAIGLTAVGVGVAQTGGQWVPRSVKIQGPSTLQSAESQMESAIQIFGYMHARKAEAEGQFAAIGGSWRVASRTVDGVVADFSGPELSQLRFPEYAIGPPSYEPATPKDAATVSSFSPQLGGGTVETRRVVGFKLNPHARPRELTFVRTAGAPDRATPPADAPPQFEFYLECIYELDGTKLRVARYDGPDGGAERPRGFKPADQAPGAPRLVVLEFERVEAGPKK